MLTIPDEKALSTLVLSEPLSAGTEDRRRNLLFTSSAAVLLTVYQLRINKTPWLDIEVPAGAPGILLGALSAALVYTLAVFVFYVWTDLHRWYLARDLIRMSGYQQVLDSMQEHLTGMKHVLYEPDQIKYADHQRSDVKRAQEAAAAHLERLLLEAATLRRSHKALSVMQLARITVFDVGLPLLLAAYALIKIGPALPPFLAAMFE